MLRKIKTAEELAKKRKRNQIIIGIVLIGLMLISTAAYSFLDNRDDSEKPVEYNGYKFYRTGEYWLLNIGQQDFYFQYLPQETENISISGNWNLEDFYERPLYIVNDNPASQEVLANLARFASRYQEACLDECEKNLPVKDCSDNLIIFIEGENKIWKEQNCTFISGDLIRGSDRFLYGLVGVK
jgi:hypothetical protein